MVKKYRIIKKLGVSGAYEYVVQKRSWCLMWVELDAGWYGDGSTFNSLQSAEKKLSAVIDAEVKYSTAKNAKYEIVKVVEVRHG